MKNWLSSLNPFHKPSAQTIVQENLEEYQRRLVAEEAAAAYHRKMVEYYKEGVIRLKAHVI